MKVQKLSEEIAHLQGAENWERHDQEPSRNKHVICWNCRGRGHQTPLPKMWGPISSRLENKTRLGVDAASVSLILL